MGNNHDKFFSKDKRKILLLGIHGAGKSTLVKMLKKDFVDNKQDLQIVDIKYNNYKFCIFDIGGSDRQRIFWRQNYYGTQGVIYIIDVSQDVAIAVQELTKVIQDQDLENTPIAIYLNKHGQVDNSEKVKEFLQDLGNPKKKLQIFEGQITDEAVILKCLTWLGKEMIPI